MAYSAEIEFFARIDIAERLGAYIEAMADLAGDAQVSEDAVNLAALLSSDDDPEPDPPVPAVAECGYCSGRGWETVVGRSGAAYRVDCRLCEGTGAVEIGDGDIGDGDEPSPARAPDLPAPAPPHLVPVRRPFDRAAHCQAIAAGGGARTVARYGAPHMRTIGKAGKQATIAKYGYGHWLGIVQGKGWSGPRVPNLAVDLAHGRELADAA